MADDKDRFAIDDKLTAQENLTAFAKSIEVLDAPLAAALSPHLDGLAAGKQLNTAELWNALYSAIMAQTEKDV